jgi:hypothetical protein
MGAMMLKLAVILIAISAVPVVTKADTTSCPPVQPSGKCARIALVKEFVGELEILYRLQETAKKELAEDPSGNGKLMTVVRVGSRTILQLNDSITRLSMIEVDAKWAKFRDMLKQVHQQRIELVQEMNYGAKKLLAGPEPGVNYGKLMARAPELTAEVEQIDKTVFTISKAMFFALVDDDRVGGDGNLHHLLLTKKDRTSMVQLIDRMFGPTTLEDKNSTHIVAAAWVIKYGLTRPHYKAADEL